jgi:hypothetical protein
LKNTVYILFLILVANFSATAQNKISTAIDVPKIVKLYPIPATTVVNFDFGASADKIATFEIYNFSGKKVYELKTPPNKVTLLLNSFSRGFYYYQIKDRTGKVVETYRFLVLK